MDFSLFWNSYPRKIAKQAALKAWNKLSTTQQQIATEVIHKHVERWKQLGTCQEFIPHASTWLNGWRFEDELEPVQESTKINIAWWSTPDTMIAKGKELGISPRIGEEWSQFKGRITNLIQQRAA